MTETEVVALMALAGVLFSASIGVVGIVLSNKTKALELLVNSLQSELAATRAEVKTNESAIKGLQRRDRALVNYVHRLRRHITDGKPPPPPEWPAELEID